MSELVMNAQYEEGYQDGYAKAKEEYEKELKRRDETLDWLISQSKKLTEVVRCKDCKHKTEACVKTGKDNYCNIMHCFHYDDWFCADGERKKESESYIGKNDSSGFVEVNGGWIEEVHP